MTPGSLGNDKKVFMKLNDWAKKAGVKYLTAYRWFKNGTLPVPAYQTDSGTIIVQDNSEVSEQNMSGNSGDAMSVLLKKTVEFSKNNSSIEDFAAYVISNFQLKLNGTAPDGPRYSKNKPKSEDIQKHFQQFIPDKGKEEQLKSIKALIKEQNKGKETLCYPASAVDKRMNEDKQNLGQLPTTDDLGFISSDEFVSDDRVDDWCAGDIVEGSVTQSVDLDSTPQQINYTGSTNLAFNNNSNTLSANDNTMPGTNLGSSGTVSSALADYRTLAAVLGGTATACSATPFQGTASSWAPTDGGVYFNSVQQSATPFMPTKKELQSAVKVIETADTDQPRSRRGRKPFKKV